MAYRTPSPIWQTTVCLIFSLLVVLSLPTLAEATTTSFTFTSDQSYTMPWAMAGTTYGGILQLTTTNFTSTSATLAIMVTNTSDPTLGNRITTFGADFQPTATINSFTAGTKFTSYQTGNVNTSGGYRVDFCAFTSNNCNGGNVSSALISGASDTFMVTLSGNFSSGFSLVDPVIKYQGGSPSNTFVATPEPAPGLLFLTGIILLGFWRYRNQLTKSFFKKA